jgi:hypothetical protein
MLSTQKQIMDKIQQYRNEATIALARGNDKKSAWWDGRADGLEEAYKIFISEGAK